MISSLVLLIALGLFSTIINTSIGGGGGLILVPLLILLFGQSPNAAIAASFVAYAVGAVISTFAYSRQGMVDYRAGLLLAASTLPGVVAGAFITASVPAPLFEPFLGIVVIVLAILMLLRREVMQRESPKRGWSRKMTDALGTHFSYTINRGIAVPAAVFQGFLSGTFGAGGGLVITPALVLAGFPTHVALATTRIIALVLSLGGSVTRFSLGQVQGEFALWLSVGALGGAFLGVQLVQRAQSRLLRKSVSLAVLALGLALVVKSFL